MYIFLHFGAWEKLKFCFEIYWPLLFAQLQHSSSWSTLSFRSVISLVLFAINSMSQRTSDFLGSPNALFILWSNLGTLCSWLKPVRTAKRTKKRNINIDNLFFFVDPSLNDLWALLWAPLFGYIFSVCWARQKPSRYQRQSSLS